MCYTLCSMNHNQGGIALFGILQGIPEKFPGGDNMKRSKRTNYNDLENMDHAEKKFYGDQMKEMGCKGFVLRDIWDVLGPYLLIIVAVISLLVGALAGLFTGVVHVRLKVRDLLAGIITMTALFSVNLLIAGGANLPVERALDTIYTAPSTIAVLGVSWLYIEKKVRYITTDDNVQ